MNLRAAGEATGDDRDAAAAFDVRSARQAAIGNLERNVRRHDEAARDIARGDRESGAGQERRRGLRSIADLRQGAAGRHHRAAGEATGIDDQQAGGGDGGCDRCTADDQLEAIGLDQSGTRDTARQHGEAPVGGNLGAACQAADSRQTTV